MGFKPGFIGMVAGTIALTTVIGLQAGEVQAAQAGGPRKAPQSTPKTQVSASSSDSSSMTEVADLGSESGAKALKLRPVTYKDASTQRPAVGLVAQDAETLYPELIQTRADGLKDVDYGRLTAVLVQALKDQQAEIAELKKQVCQTHHKAPMCVKLRKQTEEVEALAASQDQAASTVMTREPASAEASK